MAARGLTRGQRNIAWIEANCRIPEGKFVGQPVVLRPWQRKIVRGIYDTPTRRAIISFARKNAKTTLAAFLLLLHLVGPEYRQNSQLNSAAQSVEQAGILFRLAAKIVRLSPELAPHVVIRDTIKQLYCAELGTLYHALSAEVKTSFGLSPVFTVHDELGQVRGPRSDLYEALETASGAHDEPLSIIISTQAPTDADLLSLLIDDAKTGADPKTKLFLFTSDPKADPFKPATWKGPNPALGDFLNADEVKSQAEAARRMPSRESSFRNLILNQRVSQTSPVIPRAVWEACKAEPEEFTGRVFIGLDLSARNDLTALLSVSRGTDGVWDVKAEFFAPEIGVSDRAHRDRAPYDLWARQEILTLTPGASVDYAFVAERLCSLCDDFDVAEIAFDRWRIDVLKAELVRLGRECASPPFDPSYSGMRLVPFGQGFKDMSPAIDSLEAELLNKRVRHGGNPLLNWCAANAIAIRDPAHNRKLDKAKSTGRIDGFVALTMAIGRGMASEGAPAEVSFWESAA